MLFGKPEDFAIEAEVEPGLRRPSAVWGHMCVWCRGVPLGNIENTHCSLYHAFETFHWLSRHLNRLWDDQLNGLDDLAVWNFLDGRLYGFHGDLKDDTHTLEELKSDWANWSRFNFLTNVGEQFDGYESFILCPPGQSVRILSRRFPPHLGIAVNVTRPGFVAGAEGFAGWYQEQERRLVGSTPDEQ